MAAGPPDYENDNRYRAQDNVIQWVREYTGNLSTLDSSRAGHWPERESELELNMRPIPDRINAVAPRLIVRDAARAVEWYKNAFGAEERGHRILVTGRNHIQVELWFGDSAVIVVDELLEMGIRSPLTVGGTSVVLTITTEDMDALWLSAVAAGADAVPPLEEVFWGDRQAQLIDPFGHRWNLAQRCL